MSDSGTNLVRYDAMCRAIAEAYAVDEVKELRDKARALEVYAQQARNTEAERQACEIRLRAEQRGGELLKEREMAKAGRPPNRSDETTNYRGAQTLSELGISKQQSSDWQRLADIPRKDFDADLSDPTWRPTTTGLLDRHEARQHGTQPVDSDALWIWGRLKDFEREGLLSREPNDLLDTMMPHMQQTTLRLAPLVAEWLGRITP